VAVAVADCADDVWMFVCVHQRVVCCAWRGGLLHLIGQQID